MTPQDRKEVNEEIGFAIIWVTLMVLIVFGATWCEITSRVGKLDERIQKLESKSEKATP